MVNNIRNNTISEIDAKKDLNALNEIKKAEIIKYKKRTPGHKKLLNWFNDLLYIFLTDKTLESQENTKEENEDYENENENYDENENDYENEDEDDYYDYENENEKVENKKEENEDEDDDYDYKNEDEDETIDQNEMKEKNDFLDKIIDKSKSFEDQIKSLKKSRKFR